MHTPNNSPPASPPLDTRNSTLEIPKKLFIGLPIYKEVPVFFMQCLLALQKNPPCELDVRCSQGDGVARARNQLTADFLASDCTHLLFIDGDLIFSSEHVARLLSHDVDVVGGMYPKKQEGPTEWVINSCNEPTFPDARGLQEVRYIGTGFMMIKRGVFERMALYFPEIRFRADYGARGEQHDFWSMGVYEYRDRTRRYLSEDWYFCQRVSDMGGKVLADTRTILKHLGPAVFPLITQCAELFGQKEEVRGVEEDIYPARPALSPTGGQELCKCGAAQSRPGLKTSGGLNDGADLCIGRPVVSSSAPSSVLSPQSST